MIYRVSKPHRTAVGTLQLPGSKSESNRFLIIRHLCENPRVPIHNLSISDDTKVLQEALNHAELPNEINIGHAGTTMRFLTALLSITEGERIIDGSARMRERPIGILVDALRALGADIEYVGSQGYPPLRIRGKQLEGGTLQIDASMSSQYISALMMIAPKLKKGLVLQLSNQITSIPYLKMTASAMARFGAEVHWNNNEVHIPAQTYQANEVSVEPDWSAASYWYAIAALSQEVDLHLDYFLPNSLQGDSTVQHLFAPQGVATTFTNKGMKLSRTAVESSTFEYNFIEQPDLAQTLLAYAAAKGIEASMTGLHTLRIKETDRIAAMQAELAKLGATLTETEAGVFKLSPPTNHELENVPCIHTYHDHRMAMALSVCAAAGYTLDLEDPMVVSKSYPTFWDDLRSVGFVVEPIQEA